VASSIHYASSTDASTRGARDPVSEVISLLHPRITVDPGLHAAGAWALRFDPFPHVRLGVVVRGECWLSMDGFDPVHLQEGDTFLLGNPPPYVLASDLTVTPHAATSLWETVTDNTVRIGAVADEDTYVCGGHFRFDDTNAPMLLDVLPTLVLVRAGDPEGEMLAYVSQLMSAETETSAPGSSLVLHHLAQILFVQMLRAHADQTERPHGWLGAFADDGIGAALRAIHADVAHRWTVDELARTSRMSRSAFAASFKKQVGTAPLEYLIQWRMSLARDSLRRGTRTIAELARATGYESESAFSTAFRRVVGSSPSRFRDSA
jgi:AraC-like DNA-binding protein